MEEKNFMSWYRPDGVAIDFAVYEKKPGYSNSVPLHCHDYFEIEFVISGVMKNTVNGSKQRMERGDLFMLSVADSHRIDIESGNCLIYKLNFRPDAFPPDMRGLLASTPLPLVQHYDGAGFDAMLSDFKRLSRADADSDGRPLSAIALRVAAEAILCRALSRVPASETLPRLPEAVREGIRYIRENLSEPFRLSDLAAKVCLSPDHFSHLFRKYTSISPRAFLRECRMQSAHELLTSTELPVAEIAARVGYTSPSLFYRHISETYAKKPLDIRRARN